MTRSQQIAAFLDFLRQCQRDCRWAVEAQRQADLESQDLLHRFELGEDGYHQLARLGKLLRRVRRERREAKDTHELTELIDHWAQENNAAVKSLERLLGAVRQVEEKQEKRGYLERTDIIDYLEGEKS